MNSLIFWRVHRSLSGKGATRWFFGQFTINFTFRWNRWFFGELIDLWPVKVELAKCLSSDQNLVFLFRYLIMLISQNSSYLGKYNFEGNLIMYNLEKIVNHAEDSFQVSEALLNKIRFESLRLWSLISSESSNGFKKCTQKVLAKEVLRKQRIKISTAWKNFAKSFRAFWDLF